MIGEAIAIWCIYAMPFLGLLIIGGFVFEVIIPAIMRHKARKARKWGNK